MATPLDAVTVFHNGLRQDMSGIDAAALGAARGEPGHTAGLDRFRFLNEMFAWHHHGEELAVFPAVEAVAPLVTEPYLQDHHGLDAAAGAFTAAMSAGDGLETARASAALKFHLDLHLNKEDTHLYPLMRQRLSPADQGKAVGTMAGVIPRERFPEVIAWLMPLIGDDDRETMTRVWQMVMPPPVFAGATQLIRRAVGDRGWSELARRIPTLEQG